MQICGLNKTTLLDYPEHVAATVFCGGCNFRCPFCHNKGLIEGSCTRPTISEPEFFQFLKIVNLYIYAKFKRLSQKKNRAGNPTRFFLERI